MQDRRLSQCCTKELNHGGLHPEQLHSMTEYHMWPQVYRKLGSRQQSTFLVAQWLRLHASSARFRGSIPGQGARSHIPQPKLLHVITKDPAFCNEDERKISLTTTKTWCSQIYTYIHIYVHTKESMLESFNHWTPEDSWKSSFFRVSFYSGNIDL